jgi:hypothetical protein
MASYLERVAAAGARHWREPAGLRRVFRPGIYPVALPDLPGALADQIDSMEPATPPQPARQEPPPRSSGLEAGSTGGVQVGLEPDRLTSRAGRQGGRPGRTPASPARSQPPVAAQPQTHEQPGEAGRVGGSPSAGGRPPREGTVSRPASVADPPSPARSSAGSSPPIGTQAQSGAGRAARGDRRSIARDRRPPEEGGSRPAREAVRLSSARSSAGSSPPTGKQSRSGASISAASTIHGGRVAEASASRPAPESEPLSPERPSGAEGAPRPPEARERTASRPAGEPAPQGRAETEPPPEFPATREPAIALERHGPSPRVEPGGESPGRTGVAAPLAHQQPGGQEPLSAGSTPASADQTPRKMPAVSSTADSPVIAALAVGPPARTARVLPVSPGPAAQVPAPAAAARMTPMPEGPGSPSLPPAPPFGVELGPGQRNSKRAERATIVIGRMQVEVVHRPAVVRRQRPAAAPTASGSLDRGHMGRFKLTP